jgi:hypothetical protein
MSRFLAFPITRSHIITSKLARIISRFLSSLMKPLFKMPKTSNNNSNNSKLKSRSLIWVVWIIALRFRI